MLSLARIRKNLCYVCVQLMYCESPLCFYPDNVQSLHLCPQVFRGVVHEKARIEVSQDADCSTASAS